MKFPGMDWNVEAPEDHGLDAGRLADAAKAVGEIDRRYGFLVIKSDAVVHETYYEGHAASKYHTFSITKGFGATLVGIALTQGCLTAKDLIWDWLPSPPPGYKAGATLEHVMAMTAVGDLENHAYQYTCGPILNSLPAILWQATGKSPAQFFDEEMAAPLGMTLEWPRNDKGWIQIGSQGPMKVMTSTHHDVARLGHLWLNKGQWNGARIMDESFVEAALTSTFSKANNAYGYLWWLSLVAEYGRQPVARFRQPAGQCVYGVGRSRQIDDGLARSRHGRCGSGRNTGSPGANTRAVGRH